MEEVGLPDLVQSAASSVRGPFLETGSGRETWICHAHAQDS